jgi:hypothetical protein
MMVRHGFPLLLGLFLAAIVPAATAQEDHPAIDPQAREIAMNAANFLASRDKLSFNWFVSHDEVVDDLEKITYFRSGTIVLDRGDGFLAQTERGDTLRDYYFDGSVFSVVSPNENFYASTEFKGGFDALVRAIQERSDTILPLWSMLSTDFPDTMMNNVSSGAYLGTTLIASQSVHHLAFAQEELDWQVWISVDEDMPVPVMLIGTENTVTGWPQYRVYFADWNTDPEITEGQFTYQPEDDDVQMSFPVPSASAANSNNQSE